MKHLLPELGYNADALEPAISRTTIEFHHGKHHQAYVNNLNSLIEGTEYEEKSLEYIICNANGSICNNAAQAWNHTFYFEALSKDGKRKPSGRLAETIIGEWGSFEGFVSEFSKSASGLFGSGWTWLAEDAMGELHIINEQNAGNPLRNGYRPLLVIDVWEHAYYMDYQNRRADYIKAFWEILDWTVVERRFSGK